MGDLSLIYLFKMMIFHSYVKLPEGIIFRVYSATPAKPFQSKEAAGNHFFRHFRLPFWETFFGLILGFHFWATLEYT